MKKMICICLASSSFAALPPMAQSVRELQTILEDPRLYGSFGSGERIEEIIRTEKGYLVMTQHYRMDIGVLYGGGESQIIGPVYFELEFHPKSARLPFENGKNSDDPGGKSLNCNRG